MNGDRRNTLFAPVNTFNFITTDRTRRYSTPDKQDLETIYEVNKNNHRKKKEDFLFLMIIDWLNDYYDSNAHMCLLIFLSAI
jgi:hypothetical protein